MSLPKGATKPRPYPRIALPEALNVHNAVAAKTGIDPYRLMAEITDGIREPRGGAR